MQTACLKILTRLINFKTNFVTLLLRKFVARADGESGPTERRDSGRQATQCGLPEFASFTQVFPARGSTLCVENLLAIMFWSTAHFKQEPLALGTNRQPSNS